MRNFIVAFMVMILLSSIMFVLLRPINTSSEKKVKTEKSHVEKLLTEPATHNQQENKTFDTEKEETEEKRQIQEPEKIITDLFKEETQVTNEIPEPKTQQNNEKNVVKQITDNAKNNENYQSITNELMEKYGNNPNAEVSEEDVQRYMIKMLQTATPQQ